MATEKYANNASTTLNMGGGLNNSATSITVTSATGFPSAAQYRIIIDSEIMIVTAGAGTTTWTVTRGAEGTTAATHSNSAAITHILTKGAIDQVIADNIQIGAYASAPATPDKAGQLYYCNDSPTILIANSTPAWVPTFGHTQKLVLPVSGNFSWLNQGTASETQTGAGLLLSIATNNGTKLRGRLKTLANANPYTATAMMLPGITSQGGTPACGLFLRLSSGSKLITLHLAAFQAVVQQWTDENTTSTVLSQTNAAGPSATGSPIWLRIQDDSTNTIWWISYDGYTWFELFQQARTTFITADQIGYFISSGTTTATRGPCTAFLQSFQETNP